LAGNGEGAIAFAAGSLLLLLDLASRIVDPAC